MEPVKKTSKARPFWMFHGWPVGPSGTWSARKRPHCFLHLENPTFSQLKSSLRLQHTSRAKLDKAWGCNQAVLLESVRRLGSDHPLLLLAGWTWQKWTNILNLHGLLAVVAVKRMMMKDDELYSRLWFILTNILQYFIVLKNIPILCILYIISCSTCKYKHQSHSWTGHHMKIMKAYYSSLVWDLKLIGHRSSAPQTFSSWMVEIRPGTCSGKRSNHLLLAVPLFPDLFLGTTRFGHYTLLSPGWLSQLREKNNWMSNASGFWLVLRDNLLLHSCNFIKQQAAAAGLPGSSPVKNWAGHFPKTWMNPTRSEFHDVV